MERTYITVNEAAVIADVDPKTVRRWYRTGRLTRYTTGTNRVRLDAAEVQRLVRISPAPAVTGVGA